MLEPGWVFPAGRQQRDRRLVIGARWGRRPQRVEQHLRDPVGIGDLGGRMQLGQVLVQQPPVHDRIRDTRRDAQVILQHHPVTRPVAHQVGAADVRAHAIAGLSARRAETGRPVEDIHAEDPAGQDVLL